jgi:hypothetical protein
LYTDFKYCFYKQNGEVVLNEIRVLCSDGEICLKIPHTAALFSAERCLFVFHNIRDSSVSIGMRYGLDGGVRFPAGRRDISLIRSVKTGSRFHPASI